MEEAVASVIGYPLTVILMFVGVLVGALVLMVLGCLLLIRLWEAVGGWVVGLAFVVGAPLGLVYLLVRFVKWAWTD